MKPSIRSFGINRRALLSTLAVLPALSASLFSVFASAQTVPPALLHRHLENILWIDELQQPSVWPP